jgi:hypothetical protein
MMMGAQTNGSSRKRLRGEVINRSKNRDKKRDAIMRTVFARPGFASEIAKHLGVSPQNVSAWNRVPPHHVVALAPMLGLPPEKIRPDIFGGRRRI